MRVTNPCCCQQDISLGCWGLDWRRHFVNLLILRLLVPTPTPPTSVRQRDPLIDLWRGIALIDMAWVHLASYPIGMPHEAAMWIGEYTRFAAGAFVVLSGLTVRRVFGPGLEAGGAKQRATVIRLLRRAVLLVFVGRLANIAFAALEGPDLSLDPERLEKMRALLFFEKSGVTGGLLVLYAMLLATTPLVERLRQRIGDMATLAVSIGIFFLAHALGEVAHWPRWTFPTAHWQVMFFGGYLLSHHIDRVRRSDGVISTQWLAGITVAAAAILVIRNGAAIGIDPALLPVWNFQKVPLQPAELAWYATSTAFVMSWSAWMYEGSRVVRDRCGWIRRLGRWSLLVYVSHLLLELPIIAYVTMADPSPFGRGLTLIWLTLLMSWTAGAAERFKQWDPASTSGPAFLAVMRRGIPPAGTVGTAVALASLVFIGAFHLRTPEQSWSGAGEIADTGTATEEAIVEDATHQLLLEENDDAPASERASGTESGTAPFRVNESDLKGPDSAEP